MTKFEEEFKALNSWDWVNVDLIQQILKRFGNWHSDEEFQAKIKKLTDQLIIRNDELISSNYEIESLKSQLQQKVLQVEKPQLFYLKNKLTRQYLYRRDKASFDEQDYCKDSDDKPLAYCLFTKEEIDSMQNGSYKLVPVEDGESK